MALSASTYQEKLSPMAEDALQDFEDTCRVLGVDSLNIDTFASLIADCGFTGDPVPIFRALLGQCSPDSDPELGALDKAAMRKLYASPTYSLTQNTSASGERLHAAVRGLFESYDTDGDGYLTREEVSALAGHLTSGQNLLPQDRFTPRRGSAPVVAGPQQLLEAAAAIAAPHASAAAKALVAKVCSRAGDAAQGGASLEAIAAELLVYGRRSAQHLATPLVPGLSVGLVDPSHASAETFVIALEQYAMQHMATNHHFLVSLSVGAFKDDSLRLGAEFMQAYRCFTKHFTSYLRRLIELMSNDDDRALMKENLTEEMGIYDEETKEKIKALGLNLAAVDGVPHPQLYMNTMANLLEVSGCSPGQEEVFEKVAAPMREAFQACCEGDKANVPSCLAAMYLGSELIVPSMYAKIYHGLKATKKLSNDDLAFFLLHMDMDESHAAHMRSIAMKYCQSSVERLEMVTATRRIMEARCAFFDALQEHVFPSTSHGGTESGTLYNAQSANWVRTKPTCLSDFTGRPVVFEMCNPHVRGARVLDVGCGEGYVCRRMVKTGAHRVVGVDISSGMIERARAIAVPKETYFVGSATQLQQVLASRPAASCVLPGADTELGCFDLALAVFLFNYTSIHEMHLIGSQVFEMLQPGGHFVFSVPHPFMLASHGKDAADSTFHFDNSCIRNGQYFSVRDRKLAGVIKTLDGRELNVKMCFKTVSDYIEMIKASGFELVDMREARVTTEHVQAHPEFFESVCDSPLHLVFKVRRPELDWSASAQLDHPGMLASMPKKLLWRPLHFRNPARALLVAMPAEVQETLANVVLRLDSQGVTAESYFPSEPIVAALHCVADFALAVRRRLLVETGACVVRGLELQRYGDIEGQRELVDRRAKLAYYILCSFLGEVDCGTRGRLFDVRSSGLSTRGDNVLFSVSDTEASWHTDGASLDRVYGVVGLLCLAQSAHGGSLRISNAANALVELQRRLPKFLQYELMRPLPRDVMENGSGKGNVDPLSTLCRSPELLSLRVQHNAYPIFHEQGERMRFRYMRHWIETGAQKSGLAISPLLKVAMDLLDEVLDVGQIFEQPLIPGDMAFTNNMVVAHARRAFRDTPGAPPRHMVRAWIQTQKVEACA